MTITTKYNIGDTVFLVDCYGKLKETKIKGISIYVNSLNTTEIRYETNIEAGVENKFFDTKEDAAKSWLAKHGLNCGLVVG